LDQAFHREGSLITTPIKRGRTSRDTATPISRPVYMILRNFNTNPVIDTRSR
jgi:hypothetical protein